MKTFKEFQNKHDAQGHWIGINESNYNSIQSDARASLESDNAALKLKVAGLEAQVVKMRVALESSQHILQTRDVDCPFTDKAIELALKSTPDDCLKPIVDGLINLAEYWNGAEGSAVDAAEHSRHTARNLLTEMGIE